MSGQVFVLRFRETRLTFDSELLLDILEVVGIFGADRSVGSLDRHYGVIVLGTC